MKLRDFKLEVFFDKYEFRAPFLLAQSDCETMSIQELLSFSADTDEFLATPLGYTEVAGSTELRSLIASLFNNMSEEHILTHSGAEEAIFSFMNVFLNKDDHIITMSPAYQSLYEIALCMGCEVSNWELYPNDEKWSADFTELKKMIRPNTKLIVINSPHNPTGYTFSEKEVIELCEIADRNNIFVFADEVYRGLSIDGAKHPWFADIYDRSISLGVMSKSYGLAGLRIGWVASHDKNILEDMRKFKTYLSICNSAPSEALAKIALKNSDKILKRNNEIIQKNLEISDMFFEKYSNFFTYYRPQSGPVAFHRLNADESIDTFCEKLVTKSGVLLLPASVYEYDAPHFRMGYGRRNFSDNLNKFEEYLIEAKYV